MNSRNLTAKQLLDLTNLLHQMPISNFVYRNSVKIDKCFPNGPGKETSPPYQILPTIVVPIKMEKGDLHLRALLDTGSTASFIMVTASLSITSIIIESNVPLTVCTLQGESLEPSRKLRINLRTKEGGCCLNVSRCCVLWKSTRASI